MQVDMKVFLPKQVKMLKPVVKKLRDGVFEVTYRFKVMKPKPVALKKRTPKPTRKGRNGH